MASFNIISTQQDLLGHHIVERGDSPHKEFDVVFTYPDGTRTFTSSGQWVAKPNDPEAKVTHIVTPG